MRLIPGNVYRHEDIPDANRLYRELRVFPTPFKGIYYMPYQSERDGWYITDPHLVIFKASSLYLKTDRFYFGLYSALYYQRVIWNAIGTDIMNPVLSRKITRKLPSKRYWRGKIISKIMSAYPFPIRFHRIKDLSMEGLTKKGLISFSDSGKTRKDAAYLCRKGDETACDVLEFLQSGR